MAENMNPNINTDLAEAQRQIATTLAEAKSKLAEIESFAPQFMAAKTLILDEQAVIATKSDHIQKAQEHADTVRANLDRALTAATQQATEAEGLKSRAQSSADVSAELLSAVRTTKGAADTDAAAIAEARKSVEESDSLAKGLADKAATVEARITAYEKRLAELDAQCAVKLKEIVDLLPGATTVGLAHAFDDRRKTFLKPHGRWQWLFVGSVLALVILAMTGLWHVYQSGSAPSYDELVRLWLARLTVAAALVWLALHASRESALAKRLEEDYGYKAVIAAAFLGFHKQMSDIGAAVVTNEPLGKLCGDTLTTIATPPGRIYDNHKLTVSPADKLTEVAKAATEVASVAKLKA